MLCKFWTLVRRMVGHFDCLLAFFVFLFSKMNDMALLFANLCVVVEWLDVG